MLQLAQLRTMVACALIAGHLLPATAQIASTDKPYKVVFQVSDADPAKWNLALNNARNVQLDLGRENVAIEIVAYGPGLGMLTMDSTVGPRVSEALESGVSVVACENTMHGRKLSRQDMLPNISYVLAGVVELMNRQKEGYTYIRP